MWLTQEDIANLFGKGRSTVAEHVQNILGDGELDKNLVCRNFRRTASDDKGYNVLHYDLNMILAVGYRVRSPRGIQFRKWANTILKEYLVKGFVMNDERLKQADQWDYFAEGEVSLIVDGKSIDVAMGEEIFIPAGSKHTVSTSHKSSSRWYYGYRKID